MKNVSRKLILFPEFYPGYFAVIQIGKNGLEYMIRRSPVLSDGMRIYHVITEKGTLHRFECRTIGDLMVLLRKWMGEIEIAEGDGVQAPEWTLFDGEEPAHPDKECECGCGALIPYNKQAKLQRWATPQCSDYWTKKYERRRAA